MEEDWRLRHLGTQTYLRGVRFQRMRYRAYRPGWDHDHCVACWAKFSETDLPDEQTQREGYTTCSDYQHGAEYDWVCLACFELFKNAMAWTIVSSSK